MTNDTTWNEQTAHVEWDRLESEYNIDVFMTPRGDWGEYVRYESDTDGTIFIPIEWFDQSELTPDELETVEHEIGLLAWTSAPGYLDRTDYTPIRSISDLEQWFDNYFEPIETDAE